MDNLIILENNTLIFVVSRAIFIAKKSPPTMSQNEPKMPIPDISSK
jgi:hypothetical protein